MRVGGGGGEVKESKEQNWNFLRDRGFIKKKRSVGRVWIFFCNTIELVLKSK